MGMIFTVLSPEEVRRKYECAENKSAAIKMLAELTACKKSEMVEFLGLEKVPVSKYDPRVPTGQSLIVMDEELAMELYEQGHSDCEIAKRVGVNHNCIWRWRRRKGLKSNMKQRYAERDARRMALYVAGASDQEIADAEGVSRKKIQEWRYARELLSNEKKKGTSNGN